MKSTRLQRLTLLAAAALISGELSAPGSALAATPKNTCYKTPLSRVTEKNGTYLIEASDAKAALRLASDSEALIYRLDENGWIQLPLGDIGASAYHNLETACHDGTNEEKRAWIEAIVALLQKNERARLNIESEEIRQKPEWPFEVAYDTHTAFDVPLLNVKIIPPAAQGYAATKRLISSLQ